VNAPIKSDLSAPWRCGSTAWY